MSGIMDSVIDTTVQCWGCPVFDNLFNIVSGAAAAIYTQFATLCAIIFCLLFAFFVINAVWQNIKGGFGDAWYQKSIRPVVINSLVALTLLSMGVAFPRFLTTITFEPVAHMSLIYTQSMLKTTPEEINQVITYTPQPIADDGFFRVQLRDSIISLMKTTVSQFQSYMRLGVAIMDSAFSFSALFGIGNIIKHFIMFLVGVYLFYGFFKLFVRFCFYFADIIVAMTLFAFMFPLSLVLLPFSNAQSVPKWMSGLGKNIGTDQIKKLIGAIVALAAATITYTVIIVIVAKFFAANGTSVAELVDTILAPGGEIFDIELSKDNLASITLWGAIVLVYIINYLCAQIPNVKSMVLDVFNVKAENELSEQLADDAMRLTKVAAGAVKTAAKGMVDVIKGDK